MPTPEQIQEIEDLIRQAKDIDPTGNDPRAAEKYQEAIQKTDEYYGIPSPPNLRGGEPVFDPNVPSIKQADTVPAGSEIAVRIGVRAFCFPQPDGPPSAAWLAAVKFHELVGHAASIVTRLVPITLPGGTQLQLEVSVRPETAEDELGAFLAMLRSREQLGLTDEMVEWITGQVRAHWEDLDENRRWIWRWRLRPWVQL